MCCGTRRCYGIAKWSALPFRLVVLKLRQAIVQMARCIYDMICMACCVGSGLGYAWSYHERVGSWLVLERVINMSREVHINDTLMWGYERGGSYVSCSHLRVATSEEVRSWMDHMCWTTGKEVCRVGLWARRFVELDHEQVDSWKHWNP